ncbi:carboxypeptidase family protein [Micromonospora pisi]|uniref:Carboxypeptidase family protein n=1 Tax=Micromonospora pisi TaxID=589240 RepID=A0A495JK57_9ACTN|nr:carboxypeptidase family protein [Micromonospora pisi]
MTTHRHAWKRRAGVVVALVSSALLALPATPALADPPQVRNISASPSSVESGGTTEIKYTLNFGGVLGSADPANISVSSSNPKLVCVDGCTQSNVDQTGSYTARFKLDASPTANEQATITIRATAATGAPSTGTTQVTLVGKPAPPPTQAAVQTVKEISGRVTDNEGKPVPNASVVLLDSQNHSFDATTSNSGSFKFLGTTASPISPGRIDLGASFDDKNQRKQVNAAANQTLRDVRFVLAIGAATPSASAEAPPSEEALPTDEAVPTDEATPGANPQAASNEEGSGGGMGPWLLIIVGGLLVALGVGAIVLLWMRRKENSDEDEDGDTPPAGGRTSGPAGYQSGADPTRVANRAGMGGDATAISRSIADAPTMMHNRPLVDDEFPDPYGAPLPSQQPQTAAYGVPAAGGWADNGYGGAPGQGGEYGAGAPGAGAAGYGNTQGGAYGNAPGSGAGGYGAQGGGYGPGGEYGNAPGSGAGYGNAPGSGAGGYGDATGAGGYGGNYGAGEQPGGYPPPAAGGYPPAAPAGRYDEPTGRYDGPSAGGNEYAPPADPYAQGGSYGAGTADAGRGYGADQQAYGAQGYGQGGGGYEQQGADPYAAGARGYGEQPGYGAGAAGGGYDQPQAGGYDQRGGYDQQQQQRGSAGYDDRGGYDQQQGGGYYDESAQGGHGGRGGAAPGGQQPNRGERRSLDWLDD